VPEFPQTDAVIQQVRGWLAHAQTLPTDPGAERLAAMLADPQGLAFTVAFIDGVIRPEDQRVAAANLRRLARHPPAFLPVHLRAAVRVGAIGAAALPQVTIPLTQRVLRGLVDHLVIDATDARLGAAIARLSADGTRLNLNLLGEAVLGRAEADRRLERTYQLLEREDVDYVSIKVSAAVAPHAAWAFAEAVSEIEQRLLPLLNLAARRGTFINLDMEEYRDLELTLAVFMRLLDRDELLKLEAGIVLQAYLPDALAAMMALQRWSAARRARGGAAIKVRLVKGANLPMERVDAEIHGWPLATWSSKRESDTNYKRVLAYAMTPQHTDNVRLGIASHNLFDVAFARLLAERRGVTGAVEFEMLLGMASAQAQAVSETVGPLRLYTPVVHPAEFDVAIAYLIRRLEELASEDNYLSAAFTLAQDSALFKRESDRFLASFAELEALEQAEPTVPTPYRSQDRRTLTTATESAQDEPTVSGFGNAPDSDPSTAANRAWAGPIVKRIPDSTLGWMLVEAATVTSAGQLEGEIAAAAGSGAEWGALPAGQRAAILRRTAVELERRRGALIEVMGAECGKTFDQADPEVSEAVDFANYYAELAEGLDTIDGATQVPVPLTLVASPWNFPVAIPAGTTLGPLAAGSAVLLKPAPQAPRCAAVMAEALWAGGVPRAALRLINVDEGELGRALISDPRIGRLVLTGAYETAALFRSWRPDLPLLAETSGKNAIVVTPSADPELAVRDLVSSAFGHAGQKCSAASLAILVGSVASSPRFRRQLVDAVTSLEVAYPSDPRAQVGPLIAPASGKLLKALTTLAPGEHWLVEPRQLDSSGRLWSPGIKDGVVPGSEFHMIEYFGPVLGLIAARDLEQAISIQNQVPYGLTAGLHSLDSQEVSLWLGHVEAGNLYVNRAITGAIVRRQPFGGWKRSAVGAGTKAGGPNYLVGLSDWRTRPSEAVALLGPLAEQALAAARQSGLSDPWVERALRSDAEAMAGKFALSRDASGLQTERNLLRYLPVPVEIRSTDGDLAALLRVSVAGALAGARLTVSAPERLPDPIGQLLASWRVPVTVESQVRWVADLPTRPEGRIRLLSGSASAALEAAGGRPDLVIYDHSVTESGHIELLPFLHEQALSICAHRFGTPTPSVGELL
jgi:RHH-type transcriptional regulator, proline utilization regulon repressor / proline dehydrogenase / delta 1-pyrroline-5-carboxylate dehydrogenase